MRKKRFGVWGAVLISLMLSTLFMGCDLTQIEKELKDQKERLDEVEAQLKAQGDQIESLEDQLKAQGNEIESLEDQLKDLEVLKDQIESLEDQLKDLEVLNDQNLMDAGNQLNALQGAITLARLELAALRAEIDKLKNNH